MLLVLVLVPAFLLMPLLLPPLLHVLKLWQ
jgi:hypothetical protein